MVYERRSFSAIAVETTLDGTINNSVESFSVASAAGWSDAQGDFFVQIEDEMIRCETVSGNDISVKSGGRGAEGTSAVSHTSGVACLYVIGKTDLDEANYTVSETVGKITTSQDLLVADGANSLTRLGITNNRALIVSSNLVSWGQVTSAMIATDAVGSSQIAADAVGASEIAADAVGASELAANAVGVTEISTAIAGNGLTGGGGSALAVNPDGSSIEISADAVRVKAAGITQAMHAAGTLPTLSAAPTPSGVEGQVWWDSTNNIFSVYDGAAYVRTQRGTKSIAIVTSVSNTGSVTFPVAFAATPVVTATVLLPGSPSTVHVGVVMDDVSTTAVTFRVISTSNVNITITVDVHWIAIG